MQLPDTPHIARLDSKLDIRNNKKTSKTTLLLSVIALCLGVVSSVFTGYLYVTQPERINSYVQAHKDELKGDKGDRGEMGPEGPQGLTGARGVNGINSYSPTHCSSYGFGDYTSTNCY